MMRCLLAACAEQVIRNADTNTVSIISIIEELTIPRLPGVLVALNAFFFLERDPADPENPACIIRLKLDDQLLQEFPANANFQGKLRTRAFVTIGNIVISGPGVLSVSIAEANQQDPLGTWPIRVTLTAPPVAQAQVG